jgi:hypothetical protein
LDGLHPAGCQAVAAHLLARERRALGQQDVDAVSGQVVSGGRAPGAGAHHQHVDLSPVARRDGHAASPRPLVNFFTKPNTLVKAFTRA